MFRSILFRAFLALILLSGLSWIWVDRLDELTYFFNRKPLLKLDKKHVFTEIDSIADDSFVEVEGVLGNTFTTLTGLRPGSFRFGPIQVRNIADTSIFVEFDESKYGKEFAFGKDVKVRGRLQNFDGRSELRRVRDLLAGEQGFVFQENSRVLIVDEMPFSDFRYPLLFVFSLFALLASLWSVRVL